MFDWLTAAVAVELAVEVTVLVTVLVLALAEAVLVTVFVEAEQEELPPYGTAETILKRRARLESVTFIFAVRMR